MDDTIVARATASGAAAITVVRISGSNTLALLQNLIRGDVRQLESHAMKLRTIYAGDKPIDEALVAYFKAPRSFTGEDMAELYLHGSQYIVKEVVESLIQLGARQADRGEFTLRAYMNGKMDLAQAEAVADVISANSSAAHELALKQLKGGVSKKIETLRSQILEFAALIELELDFGEEDVEFADRSQLTQMILGLQKEVNALLASFKSGNAIKEGIPVAIVGKPNAGKSTLLNVLLNEDRAIVTDIEGTTRDTIEEVFEYNGLQIRLIDTAGIRETTDTIEAIGVQRTMKAVKEASLIWLLFDVSQSQEDELKAMKAMLQEHSQAEIWWVGNKMDATEQRQEGALHISAASGDIRELEEALLHYTNAIKELSDDVTITHMRHFEVLGRVQQDLRAVLNSIEARQTGDILAFNLRNAMAELGKITGVIDSNEILGEIFGKFCIGK